MMPLWLALSICFLPSLLPAQFDLVWGEEQRVATKSLVIAVPGTIGEDTYVVTGEGGFLSTTYNRRLEIHQLGPDMQTKQKKAIDLGGTGSLYELEDVVLFGGELLVFSTYRDFRKDIKYLYAQALDPKTLAGKGERMELFALPYTNGRSQATFDLKFSRDSSHIMIIADQFMGRNAPEKFFLKVFREGMEMAWEKEVQLETEEKLFSPEDWIVDKEGNVHLVGILFQDRRKYKRRGDPNYTYQLLSWLENGELEEERTISLGEEFITDLRIEVAPNLDLIASGFYSPQGTFSVNGAFYMRIDGRTGEVLSRSTREFELDFITAYFSERQERKAARKEARGRDQELYEYDIRDLIPRGDGGSVLVAEQYFVRVVTRFDPRTGQAITDYYYHYNDLIVVSIAPNGDIEWASKVPKRQVSINDGGYYSSAAQMITNGNLFFIYNDHIDNLTADGKVQRFRNFSLRDRKGVVVVAGVDIEGNVIRESLLSNKEIDAITRPKSCKQLSSNEMFLFARRRKTRQFGKIVF